MNHPDPDKLLETANALETFANTRYLSEREVNMDMPEIKPECNTPGCAAGWIALAHGYPDEAGMFYGEAADKWEEWILADSPFLTMEDWIGEYPGLWGDGRGNAIWTEAITWNWKHGQKNMPITHIIDKLRSVAKRIKETKT